MGERLLTGVIPAELAGGRFDQVLARLFSEFSRSRLQQWIREGRATVEGDVRRPRDRVIEGEHVILRVLAEPLSEIQAQAIPLNVVYEDDALLVINKPAGLVMHPAAGNPDGTLQNALLHYDPTLASVPRSGLVHRLDKDTSGLLVVARTLESHKVLVDALQARRIEREYRAVVSGVVTAGGKVDAPIGRHPAQRTRMAVVSGGRPAVTHYRVLERYRAHTYLKLMLETGRTHQIRVHMANIRYPLVGDPVYGGRLRLPAGATSELTKALRGFKRQALHAARLALEHPLSGEHMEWRSPLPEDLRQLLGILREDVGE